LGCSFQVQRDLLGKSVAIAISLCYNSGSLTNQDLRFRTPKGILLDRQQKEKKVRKMSVDFLSKVWYCRSEEFARRTLRKGANLWQRKEQMARSISANAKTTSSKRYFNLAWKVLQDMLVGQRYSTMLYYRQA